MNERVTCDLSLIGDAENQGVKYSLEILVGHKQLKTFTLCFGVRVLVPSQSSS